jgi:hypothetical protein
MSKWWCEPILDIYVSIAFQWYKKLLKEWVLTPAIGHHVLLLKLMSNIHIEQGQCVLPSHLFWQLSSPHFESVNFIFTLSQSRVVTWNVLSCDKSTIELGNHSNLKRLNKSNATCKLWSFSNSMGTFSNLWHCHNRKVLSCDKSTIESGNHSNLKRLNKSNVTCKLWSFSNSMGTFSNLWHCHNRKVLSCDKSTIESGKQPN